MTRMITRHTGSRPAESIPNYYAYRLHLNGRKLSAARAKYFIECVQKISRENFKMIYRGDKKNTLLPILGISNHEFPSRFNQSIFLMGPKARMFVTTLLPKDREIDIAAASNNEFQLIFTMLSNLLNKELRFSARRTAMTMFRVREGELTAYFRNRENISDFVKKMDQLPVQSRIIIRDYYLALLHHLDISEYYTSSFLLSTTTSFEQAHGFAWKDEVPNSTNPIIIVGWVPRNFEGRLSAPDARILKKKVNIDEFNLPVYNLSFFPKQDEITLKGGLLPHYLLGYIHNDTRKGEVFEINPALFDTDTSWNGTELNIDQRSFNDRIRHTMFGMYFSVTEDDFRQHRI